MSTQHPAPTTIDTPEAGEASCSTPLPAGPWALYVAERRLGQRIPPSVRPESWRPSDARRQADAQVRSESPTAEIL